jgi:Arc/MetJ-type ribon-helix-helix transcriptional regulator
MRFSREDKPESKGTLLSVRLTKPQMETLERLVAELGIVGGRAELVRQAIDFWMSHDRRARQAMQRISRDES